MVRHLLGEVQKLWTKHLFGNGQNAYLPKTIKYSRPLFNANTILSSQV